MTFPAGQADACDRSLWKRQQTATVRAALKRGHVALSSVVLDVPECVADRPAWEIVGWARGVGPSNLAVLNERAMLQRINLARPLGTLSSRQRGWIAENAVMYGTAGLQAA